MICIHADGLDLQFRRQGILSGLVELYLLGSILQKVEQTRSRESYPLPPQIYH